MSYFDDVAMQLVGRTIVAVGVGDCGCGFPVTVLTLDDGTAVSCLQDPEGNGPGALLVSRDGDYLGTI